MRLRGEAYFLIGVIVVMLVIIISALTMPAIESKLFPLMFGGVTLFLASLALSKELLLRRNQKASEAPAAAEVKDKDSGGEKKESWRGYLVHIAWVAGFILGIYLLGFVISVPLFVLSYMRYLGTRWLTVIISAVVLTLVIHFGFDIALEMELPQGLIFTWLDR